MIRDIEDTRGCDRKSHQEQERTDQDRSFQIAWVTKKNLEFSLHTFHCDQRSIKEGTLTSTLFTLSFKFDCRLKGLIEILNRIVSLRLTLLEGFKQNKLDRPW
jgi:hypothetical protein